MLLPFLQNFLGMLGATTPIFSGPIPTLSAQPATGTHVFDLGAYFSGATSYSISPAVEAGWSFNTTNGQLTIDTDDTNTFGPYTVTATNASGSTNSNTFTVRVAAVVWDLTGVDFGWKTARYAYRDKEFLAIMKQEATTEGIWCSWRFGTSILRGSANLLFNYTLIKQEANGNAGWARWAPGTGARHATADLQINVRSALTVNFTLS